MTSTATTATSSTARPDGFETARNAIAAAKARHAVGSAKWLFVGSVASEFWSGRIGQTSLLETLSRV